MLSDGQNNHACWFISLSLRPTHMGSLTLVSTLLGDQGTGAGKVIWKNQRLGGLQCNSLPHGFVSVIGLLCHMDGAFAHLHTPQGPPYWRHATSIFFSESLFSDLPLLTTLHPSSVRLQSNLAPCYLSSDPSSNDFVAYPSVSNLISLFSSSWRHTDWVPKCHLSQTLTIQKWRGREAGYLCHNPKQHGGTGSGGRVNLVAEGRMGHTEMMHLLWGIVYLSDLSVELSGQHLGIQI